MTKNGQVAALAKHKKDGKVYLIRYTRGDKHWEIIDKNIDQ